jgi:hypothetical protein
MKRVKVVNPMTPVISRPRPRFPFNTNIAPRKKGPGVPASLDTNFSSRDMN